MAEGRERRAVGAAAIEASGLFDAEWYREHYPDVAADGIDPFEHFVRWGAEEGRLPFGDFASDRYRREAGIAHASNLETYRHYLTQGRFTATTALDPPGFVPYRIDRNAALSADDDLLVYVAYCPDGRLAPFQVHSIETYHTEGYRVALIVNSGAYCGMVDPGETPSPIQIVRDNIGFDFGAWAHAVRILGGLEAVRSVTFTNDSLVGPLVGGKACRLRSRIDDIEAGAVFLTECREIERHPQGY